jgi:holliday junction DNA helicase RuvA
MIVRLTGTLESIDGNRAVLAIDAATAREVLVPAYMAARFAAGSQVGERVTLHTLEYLEGQGQGTSFIPRLVGFGAARERDFFELFTTVKGLGNKRALRALAEEPGVIARAILSQDARALQRLPEIGKRLAETIIVDLKEKVEAFVADFGGADGVPGGAGIEVKAARRSMAGLGPAARDAVEALVSLGETPADAERKVLRAMERRPEIAGTEEILAAALGGA